MIREIRIMGLRQAGAIFWNALGGVLLAYLLLTATLIIYRHPHRLDLTRDEENTLSPDTLNRLRLLNEDVRIVFPWFIQIENPLHRIQWQVLDRGRTLLEEYLAAQPRLRIEAQLHLASPRDNDAWKEIAARYKLSPTQVNCFYFLLGEGELRQAVTADDLAVYDRPAGLHDPNPPQIREFHGESAFTAAITRLVERQKKKLYSLEEHGEPRLGDDGPGGLGAFRVEMERAGYQAVPLALSLEAGVPEGCNLLVIAAPAAPLRLEDRQKIQDYLHRGGRLLAVPGPSKTGLEEVLDSFGVRVQSGRPLRREGSTWEPIFVVREAPSDHPIVRPFQGQRLEVYFLHPRALEFRSAESLHGEQFLRTAHKVPPLLDLNGNRQKDEGEPTGQVALAGAVWRRRPAREPPDYRHVDTRLVVLGSATPLINEFLLQASHRDLVLNSVNWLLGREERLSVGSTAWKERRLKWDDRIRSWLFWMPVAVFPGVVLVLGGLVYFARRA